MYKIGHNALFYFADPWFITLARVSGVAITVSHLYANTDGLVWMKLMGIAGAAIVMDMKKKGLVTNPFLKEFEGTPLHDITRRWVRLILAYAQDLFDGYEPFHSDVVPDIVLAVAGGLMCQCKLLGEEHCAHWILKLLGLGHLCLMKEDEGYGDEEETEKINLKWFSNVYEMYGNNLFWK
jgi:hypothetical protein